MAADALASKSKQAGPFYRGEARSDLHRVWDRSRSLQIVEVGGVLVPMMTEEFGNIIKDDVEERRKVIEFAGVSAN